MTQKQQKTAPKTISQIIADAKQAERDRLLNPRHLGRADYLSSVVLTERMIEGIIGASSGSAATLILARMALSEATKGRREAASLRQIIIVLMLCWGGACGVLGAGAALWWTHGAG